MTSGSPQIVPLCNDCKHYLKWHPGYCDRLVTRWMLEKLLGTFELPETWRCLWGRLDGPCGRQGKLYEPRDV